jgi:hypothetical protein
MRPFADQRNGWKRVAIGVLDIGNRRWRRISPLVPFRHRQPSKCKPHPCTRLGLSYLTSSLFHHVHPYTSCKSKCSLITNAKLTGIRRPIFSDLSLTLPPRTPFLAVSSDRRPSPLEGLLPRLSHTMLLLLVVDQVDTLPPSRLLSSV